MRPEVATTDSLKVEGYQVLIEVSFYRLQRSCEGYVFTPVCQSFCSQGGGRGVYPIACWDTHTHTQVRHRSRSDTHPQVRHPQGQTPPGQTPYQGQTPTPRSDTPKVRHPQDQRQTPHPPGGGRPLLWTVCILLECILVCCIFFSSNTILADLTE